MLTMLFSCVALAWRKANMSCVIIHPLPAWFLSINTFPWQNIASSAPVISAFVANAVTDHRCVTCSQSPRYIIRRYQLYEGIIYSCVTLNLVHLIECGLCMFIYMCRILIKWCLSLSEKSQRISKVYMQCYWYRLFPTVFSISQQSYILW